MFKLEQRTAEQQCILIINEEMNNRSKNNLLNESRSASKYDSITTRTLLSDLFSKQFLTNVRTQLRANQKNSRNYQSNKLISQPQMNNPQNQTEQLKSKLNWLTKQNNQLKLQLNKISELNQNNSIDAPSSQLFHKYLNNKKLIVIRQVQLSIVPQRQMINNQQLQQLKEKIQNLQKQKTIKQSRLSELLEKQARYQSQIRFLKAKEQNLEQQIKNLKEAIKIQGQDINDKPLKQTNRSEIKIRVSQSNLNHQKQPLRKWFQNQQQVTELINRIIANLKNSSESQLLASQCFNIELPNSIDFNNSIPLKKTLSQGQQIKEIDGILQAELPFLHLSEYPSIRNSDLNQSSPLIDKMEIDQSQICIEINSNNKLQGNCIEQSSIFIDTNSLPPSSTNQLENQNNAVNQKINLNDSVIQINLNI